MSETTAIYYEFTELELCEDEFFNLVFMNAPDDWKKKEAENNFLMDICTSPLEEVVKEVREKSSYKGNDPTEVFRNISVVAEGEDKPWFARHANISQQFDKDRMDRLWIRNLSCYQDRDGRPKGERICCPTGSFYADDGNGRALVYAMHIECGRTKYSKVDAIHATSWEIATGILKFPPQRAAALEHDGKFQGDKILIDEFQIPIGIQINWQKRI